MAQDICIHSALPTKLLLGWPRPSPKTRPAAWARNPLMFLWFDYHLIFMCCVKITKKTITKTKTTTKNNNQKQKTKTTFVVVSCPRECVDNVEFNESWRNCRFPGRGGQTLARAFGVILIAAERLRNRTRRSSSECRDPLVLSLCLLYVTQ